MWCNGESVKSNSVQILFIYSKCIPLVVNSNNQYKKGTLLLEENRATVLNK